MAPLCGSSFYTLLVRDEKENPEVPSLDTPAKEKHRASPFISVEQRVLFSCMR
jgi:hypothetical protein